MGEFLDVFFGSSQSLYASYAILAAIITICITILLTGTDIPMSNRFLFVFLTILMLLPSVFLILFQITCMVTGGSKDTRWWCWLYAWIVAAFIIIYCIFVIIISFSSLFTYTNAISKVEIQDATNKASPELSNEYARKVMVEDFEQQILMDQFENNTNQGSIVQDGVYGSANGQSSTTTNNDAVRASTANNDTVRASTANNDTVRASTANNNNDTVRASTANNNNDAVPASTANNNNDAVPASNPKRESSASSSLFGQLLPQIQQPQTTDKFTGGLTFDDPFDKLEAFTNDKSYSAY